MVTLKARVDLKDKGLRIRKSMSRKPPTHKYLRMKSPERKTRRRRRIRRVNLKGLKLLQEWVKHCR